MCDGGGSSAAASLEASIRGPVGAFSSAFNGVTGATTSSLISLDFFFPPSRIPNSLKPLSSGVVASTRAAESGAGGVAAPGVPNLEFVPGPV